MSMSLEEKVADAIRVTQAALQKSAADNAAMQADLEKQAAVVADHTEAEKTYAAFAAELVRHNRIGRGKEARAIEQARTHTGLLKLALALADPDRVEAPAKLGTPATKTASGERNAFNVVGGRVPVGERESDRAWMEALGVSK